MASAQTEPRVYAGESAAERRLRRRSALVDASLELVAEGGRERMSIAALCRAADLNTRYFYESFSDLDEVVAALLERLTEEAILAATAALPQPGPGGEPRPPDEQDARAAVAAFVDYLTDDPRRGRVLFGAVPAGTAAAEQRDETLRRFIAAAVAHGRTIYRIGEDDRIDIAAAVMVGGTGRAVLDWIDGRVAGPRDQLVSELVSIWLAIAESTTRRVRGG